MLPETFEELGNQQANLVAELHDQTPGSQEWLNTKKCIDGLTDSMKDEANRMERQEKEKLDRLQSNHEAQIALVKELGKAGIPILGIGSLALFVTYVENHPEAMLSKFAWKLIDKVLKI